LFEQPHETISGGMGYLLMKIEAILLYCVIIAVFSDTNSGMGENHVRGIG
jgi:hypothetical protein